MLIIIGGAHHGAAASGAQPRPHRLPVEARMANQVNGITDPEIAGIMGWRGPGAHTEAALRKIKRVLEEDRNRRAASPVGDDGLPPLSEPTSLGWNAATAGVRGYTADQYRQGQREAVAAKARDYELLELIAEQMKVRLLAADERIEELEAGRRAAVPAQTGTQPAGDSVDTPEFQRLVEYWRGEPYGSRSFENAWDELVAHIHAWATRRAAVSTASAPEQPALMRQAVASVVSRAGNDLRVGWLRPERCDVGTLLYVAAPSSPVE